MIVANIIDVTNNATLKSVAMLKWAVEECDTKYVLKTSDDVFVNIINLDGFIHNPLKVRPKLLVGQLESNENVDRDSLHDRLDLKRLKILNYYLLKLIFMQIHATIHVPVRDVP